MAHRLFTQLSITFLHKALEPAPLERVRIRNLFEHLLGLRADLIQRLLKPRVLDGQPLQVGFSGQSCLGKISLESLVRREVAFGPFERVRGVTQLLRESVTGCRTLRQFAVVLSPTLGELRGRHRELRRMPLVGVAVCHFGARQHLLECLVRRDFVPEVCLELRLTLPGSASLSRGVPFCIVQ